MIDLEKDNRIIFDQSNPNWSPYHETNRIFLNAQENYLNQLLRSRGHVFVNDVRDALGLPRTPGGQLVGWLYNNDNQSHISFSDLEEIDHAVHINLNTDGVIYDKI